jgi:hypothetical protein
VTARRTKVDFVGFVAGLLQTVYAGVRKVPLVLDNLNTHFRASFEEVLGGAPAAVLLNRIEFHYTPKHASWLNMAELEIGILNRQCIGRRFPNAELLVAEVAAWQRRRNAEHHGIRWGFTRQDADRKLGRHYVT